MTIVNKQKGVDLNMESSNGVANATEEPTGMLLSESPGSQLKT
jgi:hypothetical protein